MSEKHMCRECGDVTIMSPSRVRKSDYVCNKCKRRRSGAQQRKLQAERGKQPITEQKFTSKRKYKAVQKARKRAEELGLPCDLEREDDFTWPDVCPVLGIPLDERSRDYTPSIDRLKPEEGYTKDNCRIISMRANRLKNDATTQELEAILSYMKNFEN